MQHKQIEIIGLECTMLFEHILDCLDDVNLKYLTKIMRHINGRAVADPLSFESFAIPSRRIYWRVFNLSTIALRSWPVPWNNERAILSGSIVQSEYNLLLM